MDMTFLGTGGAWGLPELNCDCLICREMRRKGEKRERTSLLFSDGDTLLVDCGPDAKAQLVRHRVKSLSAVLVTHEHGDHYIGLDELFAYKRNTPREAFSPIPVYLTDESRRVIAPRFDYLERLGVIEIRTVEAGVRFSVGNFEILPFRTEHGAFAKGSVGYLIMGPAAGGGESRVLYTSDFMDIPEIHDEMLEPDYLVVQSFWLHEPLHNRPHHMSFQRAPEYIIRLNPRAETFLVHMGDADQVVGDPENHQAKKYEPADPLRPPSGGPAYPVPRNQQQWQETVDRVLADRKLAYRVTVARDGKMVTI